MKEKAKNKNKKATTKGDLVSSIAEFSGLSKANSTRALVGFMESIKKGLKDGEDIKILGLGTFHVIKRKAGMGRNPRTGEPLKIKEAKLPKFRASKALKEAIS
jgi:DNA-binding protein HU-beta